MKDRSSNSLIDFKFTGYLAVRSKLRIDDLLSVFLEFKNNNGTIAKTKLTRAFLYVLAKYT